MCFLLGFQAPFCGVSLWTAISAVLLAPATVTFPVQGKARYQGNHTTALASKINYYPSGGSKNSSWPVTLIQTKGLTGTGSFRYCCDDLKTHFGDYVLIDCRPSVTKWSYARHSKNSHIWCYEKILWQFSTKVILLLKSFSLMCLYKFWVIYSTRGEEFSRQHAELTEVKKKITSAGGTMLPVTFHLSRKSRAKSIYHYQGQ